MGGTRPEFVVVETVQGEVKANMLKAHLESEGIPVVLSYESAGVVFAATGCRRTVFNFSGADFLGSPKYTS